MLKWGWKMAFYALLWSCERDVLRIFRWAHFFIFLQILSDSYRFRYNSQR